MKLTNLLLPIIISLLSCNKKGDKEIILNKINYLESIGGNPFDNTTIFLIREGETPSYSVRRFDTTHNYAVITLKPEPKINKNFLVDSIDINFVKTFKLLGCLNLISRNNFTRLDFYANDEKIILFKGIPTDSLHLPFDRSKAIKINEQWSYFTFHRTSK